MGTQQRPPVITVNFAVHNINEDHGPTGIWPRRGRPRDDVRPMPHTEEPQEILRSTLAPMLRGACVIRDSRIWHGGTPNSKSMPRFLPNLEFFSREYADANDFQGGKGKGKGNRFSRGTMT